MKMRKDGRLTANFRVTDVLTGKSKRVFVYGYTEDELKRELERAKKLYANNMSLSSSLFKDWLAEWLKIKQAEISTSTYDSYLIIINKHIKPYLDNFRLEDISSAVIRRVLQQVQGERSKKYVYSLLNAIMHQAYADELIKRNPCISVKAPKYTAKEKDIITPEEFKAICDNTSEQYKRVFILAYYTGMRRGEISALKWQNIDFNKKLISVSASVKITANGLIVGPPKTECSIRKILMPDTVIKALQEQQRYQKERYLKHGCKVTNEDYVFNSEKYYSNIMPPNALTKNFISARKIANVNPTLTFHSFRHTHTTMLVEAGAPIKAIQSRLGHSSPSFTLARYAHNTEKMQREIVDIINSRTKII